jgi:hypothetical protein
MHLLTDTSLFFALPNDCLCQLVGEPIVYIHLDSFQLFTADPPPKRPSKRPFPFSEDGVRGPAKRTKLTNAGFSSAAAPGTKTHEYICLFLQPPRIASHPISKFQGPSHESPAGPRTAVLRTRDAPVALERDRRWSASET